MNSTNTDTVPEIIKRIKSILNDVPGLQLAILYGSAATGRMRKDSDVDIALLFDRPISAQQKMELRSHVESELRHDVDLADLYALNGTILKQILTKGLVLVQSKPGVLAGLVQRMIYNQADMMPYVTRTLCERQRRFVHG
jgi:predicted nucleotidyltransferase